MRSCSEEMRNDCDAGVEVAFFDANTMAEVEELNRDYSRQHKKLRRSVEQTRDPVDGGQTGPNGNRVGYTADGDKVEWIPDNELWDNVWWNRHQNWLAEIESGEETLTSVTRQRRFSVSARNDGV